jgi:hypothetical protein
MTQSPLPSSDERASFEAHFKHLDHSTTKDAWDRPVYVYPIVCALWDGWQARAALASAAASGEASGVQEAEAPNFCARCGKRLGAGIHTCSLPREDGAAVEGLTK